MGKYVKCEANYREVLIISEYNLNFMKKKIQFHYKTNRIFFNVSEFVIIVRLSDLKRDNGRKISTVPVFFFHVAFV